MFETLRKLFDSSMFMPHGHCYLWRPDILWLNVISDALIALAYFAIPLFLVQLVRKRDDLSFNWTILLFAMFIFACGVTHSIEIWTIWNPQYVLLGISKAITAFVSVATAFTLFRLLPQALKIPSQSHLRQTNDALKREVEERKSTEKMQDMQLTVSRILADADSSTEALSKTFSAVCEKFDWVYGAAWLVNNEGTKLVPEVFHHDGSQDLAAKTEELTHGSNLSSVERVSEKVWRSHQPVWLSNFGDDPVLDSTIKTTQSLLQSTLAFPIIGGGNVLGVIELSSRNPQSSNPRLLEIYADVGLRVGTFLLRRQAQKKLQDMYKEIGQIVGDRTAELRTVNDQLLYTTAMLNSIVTTSPDIIYVKDQYSRMIFCNPSTLTRIGKTEHEIYGKNDVEHLGPGNGGEEILQTDARIIASGIGESIEEWVTFANGDRLLYLSSKEPRLDHNGRVIGLVGISRDITDRNRIEIQMREARAEADRANDTKSAFLANMSHEIRTPLSAILGFSELLKDPTLDTAERNRYTDTIVRNGTSLTRIIDDILDLAKVEAGRLEIEKVDFSIFDLMGEVVDLFLEKTKQKGIGLRLDFDENTPRKIYSDPGRIRQILINIVGNAVKFTENGSVDVTVKSMHLNGDRFLINIDIKDTGVGLTEEQRSRIFQPFGQADHTTTRKYGGTGLGLALAHRLAQALDGNITLGDFGSGGCTFVVTFIATSGSNSTIKKKAVDLSRPKSKADLTDIRVLAVDDAPDNLLLVKRILEKNGASVDTAADGREAIESAFERDYDIVLMDIQMPNIDGYQAIRALRQRGYTVPVVALTAHAMREEITRIESAGFSGYLSKPLNLAELLETVERLGATKIR